MYFALVNLLQRPGLRSDNKDLPKYVLPTNMLPKPVIKKENPYFVLTRYCDQNMYYSKEFK